MTGAKWFVPDAASASRGLFPSALPLWGESWHCPFCILLVIYTFGSILEGSIDKLQAYGLVSRGNEFNVCLFVGLKTTQSVPMQGLS